MSAPARTVSAIPPADRPADSRGAAGSASDGSSAHWASSTVKDQRPTFGDVDDEPVQAVQRGECDIACLPRRRISVNTGSESRAAPASSRARSAAFAPRAWTSSNWRTIPKPNPRSSSPARADRTVIPDAQARLRSSSSSAVLPIPGGPSISTMPPVPPTASANAASIAARSSSRSRSRGLLA